MTTEQFETFIKQNPNIEVRFDDDNAYCRNENLPWYGNNEGNCTGITKAKFKTLTPDELCDEINRGLNVEGITRVTGYFAKVSHWNKGKIGELKDRVRQSV